MVAQRRLRIGMIGGGPGAFIGGVHRIALSMDGVFELVAGAFSSDPARSREAGVELGIDPERVYGSFEAMVAREKDLGPEERLDAVSIVTPNSVHEGPAVAFLEAGFDVICDKPLTVDSASAARIAQAVEKSGRSFCLTHNYGSNAMAVEARQMVARGAVGDVRKVYVEYLQGWLADPIEKTGHKQASWRTDPKRNGPGGALGDIGTHAFHIAEFVSGLQVTRLIGDRRAFVEGRPVDDDAVVLLEFDGGRATGTLACSQVCAGRENGLRVRVFGTKGGLEWDQELPMQLKVYQQDRPMEIRMAANGYLSEQAQALGRVPPGHPEGYLEGFANVYRAFAATIRGEASAGYPTVEDGVRGVQFVEAVIASSDAGAWVDVPSSE